MSQEDIDENVQRPLAKEERPKTYFELIERVGDSGKYQFKIMLIFLVNWYVTGVILMSTAFLFQNKEFDCQSKGLLVKQCNDYVCALPREQWDSFSSFGNQGKQFKSLATEFRQYYCEDTTYIDLASSSTYFGAFIGYVLISFFSDNFGRRTSMLLAWTCTTLGTIIVAVSQDIYTASAGLFLSGAGGDAAINICFFFFGEVVGDKKRQEYSIIIQIAFTLGAMTITLLFYLLDNWRIIWIIGAAIPALVGLLLVTTYLQETPQFLIRKGVDVALKSLNRIGKINKDRKEILEEEDIQNVISKQVVVQFNKMITPVDLLRFPSLRVISICCSIISFMTYAMYYGPTLIIGDIGFNIYVSSFMVQLSELVTFLPLYIFIERIQRRTMGILLNLIATCMACFLVFYQKPEQCDLCVESIIELVIVFIFRLCVSFFFAFFQMYTCELYPSRARGLGSGIVSAIGTIASASSPILLGHLRRQGINVMIFFVLFGIISVGSLTILTETKGLPLKEEIDQIQLEKEKRRSEVDIRRSKSSNTGNLRSQITADNINVKKTGGRVIKSELHE